MGKKSRKIAKTQQKGQQIEKMQHIDAVKAEMKAYMEKEDYARALEMLAKLIDQKYYEADLIYDGAYAYFMLGDYPRAINWVNTTLTYAPAHVQARILLGRICILEDRTEDGLAILDFVLEHHRAVLPQEELDEMEEILEYYGRSEADKIRGNYPHIAAFLGLIEQTDGAKKTDTAAVKAKSMIDEMKSLMQVGDEELATVPAVREKPQELSVEEADVEAAAPAEQSVDEVLMAIRSKQVSLLEKIRICNAFAGASYSENNLDEARAYLTAALEIDSCHEQTLRNMVQLELLRGDKEKALAYAARLPWSDFALLDQLSDRR